MPNPQQYCILKLETVPLNLEETNGTCQCEQGYYEQNYECNECHITCNI